MSGLGAWSGGHHDCKSASFPRPLWRLHRAQSPPQATTPSASTPHPAGPLPPTQPLSVAPPTVRPVEWGEAGAPGWRARQGRSLFLGATLHVLALSTDAGMAVATAARSCCSAGWWESQQP